MNSSSRIHCLFTALILWRASAYISDNDAVKRTRSRSLPKRIPTPPFPDGPCGGRLVTIPGEKLYEKDSSFFNINALNPFTTRDDVKLPKRDVSVWLPAEYDMKEFEGEDFPILYCHDGQNGEYINGCS